MKRPDTGSIKNGIMVFAASLIDAKIESDTMLIGMFSSKDDRKDTIKKLRLNIRRMKIARDVIDDLAGCWS